jgi:hypothetical protein
MNKGFLRLENGTRWPNPQSKEYHDLSWRLRHAPETISAVDAHNIASAMDAYSMLINHPAYTLKHVQKQVSMIRKAIKEVIK